MSDRKRPKRGSDPLLTRRLRQALAAPGCPLCRLVRAGEERWLATLLYELSGDPLTHHKLARAEGLCGEHARILALLVERCTLLTPAAVARLYESVVGTMLEKPVRLTNQVGSCPACRYRQGLLGHQAEILARFLAGEEGRVAYLGSDGLCLPHLRLVLKSATSEVARWLEADFRVRLSELRHRLGELQRKQRYDVAEPLSAEEAGAWQEALWRLGGNWFGQLVTPPGEI
ncbi:MAG TPA: hypothetical protein ENI38_00845 [Candidatus Acetothermia bacterium]|nr:hypothetical protein [Candidatus Acetothermia bacterium]